MAGFGGIGGVSPIFASILAQPFQAAAIRPGEVLKGVVQSVEPQTLIRFGGLVIPIEKVAALRPGQSVNAEVVRTEQGLQLRITSVSQQPIQNPSPETANLAFRDLPGIIVQALQSLGKLELAEQAAALVPRTIADNPAAVKLVLGLLLERADGDDDVQRVIRIIHQAVDEGVLPESDAREILPTLRGLTSGDAEDIVQLLRHAATSSQRSVIGRLAEGIAKGRVQQALATLLDDVPAALARLSEHEAFTEFVRQTGQQTDFHRAIEHLVDRFAAAQLVNFRGSEVPYVFVALPMPAESPIRHAQIHVMGEGGGKAQRFDAKNATVVLDLSTSNLGDLWITLTTAHGGCTCMIRARELDAVDLIHAHADALAAGLATAGYPGANVQAALWDGNRVRELATMLRRFKGLNVEA